MDWHIKTISEVLGELRTSERGLDAKEIERRLLQYGPNKLPEAKSESYFFIFLRQFQSPLIYILLVAGVVVFALGQKTDAVVIFLVLFVNAIVGALQEGRAQNILSALKKFVEVQATALRDGKELILSDADLVPGDIIILQEGEKVPADARVIFASGLKIDEAALSGESIPIDKTEEALASFDLPVSEQKNMIFKGTFIVSGDGKAVVVATGVNTQIGKITKEIATIDAEIPLKADVRSLAKYIIFATAVFSVSIFLFGIFISGKTLLEMFLVVVALAVSFIPEGLPVALTLILASGVWRLTKQNVLVKRLQAVEALGQAKIIAVDKTGTLTKNELVIRKVYVDGKFYNIKGSGYEPKGEVEFEGRAIDPSNHEDLIFSGKVAAFCANARIMYLENEKRWKVAGDPTEAAMLVFAEKIGFRKEDFERESPRLGEIPFNYKTKYHATLHRDGKSTLLTVVGAPEEVLGFSTRIRQDGDDQPLSKQNKEKLEKIFAQMSGDGLRVLAFAVRKTEVETEVLAPGKVKDLIFVGFFGIKDALREQVPDVMQKAKNAGIKVVMITGDHKITAHAIAREAGVFKDGDEIITGSELDEMNENELALRLDRTSVFARVTPEHKLKIIRAYKKRGEVVAMTGDGVNDALSLVAADLGVGMGKIGTEVAKEASDIILLDDNFGGIIAAIEEGKNIYKTIQKVLRYLFSTNLGEVFTIALALFAGYPLPLAASQIIWLNFVTDGFLVAALAMEPKETGLLNAKNEKRKLVSRELLFHSLFIAVIIMAGSFFIFQKYLSAFDLLKVQTMVLTTMAVFQWFRVISARSHEKSIFQINPFSNKFLIGGVMTVIALQIMAIYAPFMQKILHTISLDISDWALIIVVTFSVIVLEEARKLIVKLWK